MKRPLLLSFGLLLLSLLTAVISVNAYSTASAGLSIKTSSDDALLTPSVYFATPPDNYPCNEIGVYINNPNDQLSRVELYRSRSADSGFELIATLNEGEAYYSDQDLVSQKTYYYCIESINENGVSERTKVIEVK